MLVHHIALVSETPALPLADLMRTAAALQKQVSRDFAPVWKVHATVSAFSCLKDVPHGYWPIRIGDEGQAGGGVHLDTLNQPYALVDYTSDWTVTASHECLEILADPFGNRLVAGQSPRPGQGRVQFLVEVCDPCERSFYLVNGIRVSDFYTPHYFDPVAHPAVRYDYMGVLRQPRAVDAGGYLSWVDPVTDEWSQLRWWGAEPELVNFGPMGACFSLREWIDRRTRQDRIHPKERA